MKITAENAHQRPSLDVLSALSEYDDFMESIKTLVDLGCGQGEDLEWWATRTVRDNPAQALNIKCVGVDLSPQLDIVRSHNNITYQSTDFETQIFPPRDLFDILWCFDAFQYCKDPVKTLTKWKDIASPGAMLVISIPQTLKIKGQNLCHYLPSGVLYHYTIVSLINMLAMAGWDCKNGFFQQSAQNLWIRAVVYKTEMPPFDIRTTTWYDLADSGLLPDSAVKSVQAHGFLRQEDLVVPWLDHSLSWLGKP
jgi:trans-aconitate methyltransferase